MIKPDLNGPLRTTVLAALWGSNSSGCRGLSGTPGPIPAPVDWQLRALPQPLLQSPPGHHHHCLHCHCCQQAPTPPSGHFYHHWLPWGSVPFTCTMTLSDAPSEACCCRTASSGSKRLDIYLFGYYSETNQNMNHQFFFHMT